MTDYTIIKSSADSAKVIVHTPDAQKFFEIEYYMDFDNGESAIPLTTVEEFQIDAAYAGHLVCDVL